MSRPMMMRNSTSGMRLRLKISLKRWAVKMSKPMMAMVSPMSFEELPLAACSAMVLMMSGFGKASLSCGKESLNLDNVFVVGMRSG